MEKNRTSPEDNNITIRQTLGRRVVYAFQRPIKKIKEVVTGDKASESGVESIGKMATMHFPHAETLQPADIADDDYDAVNLQVPMDKSGFPRPEDQHVVDPDPLQQLETGLRLAASNERSPEVAEELDETFGLTRQRITGSQESQEKIKKLYEQVPPG